MRTLIHDAGWIQFYRLTSGSICVEERISLPETIDLEMDNAIAADFCARGVVTDAEGRAIGTPFTYIITHTLTALSFVPLANFREEECRDASLTLSFDLTPQEEGSLPFTISRMGFQRIERMGDGWPLGR